MKHMNTARIDESALNELIKLKSKDLVARLKTDDEDALNELVSFMKPALGVMGDVRDMIEVRLAEGDELRKNQAAVVNFGGTWILRVALIIRGMFKATVVDVTCFRNAETKQIFIVPAADTRNRDVVSAAQKAGEAMIDLLTNKKVLKKAFTDDIKSALVNEVIATTAAAERVKPKEDGSFDQLPTWSKISGALPGAIRGWVGDNLEDIIAKFEGATSEVSKTEEESKEPAAVAAGSEDTKDVI